MTMLSRVAERLYWNARYLERAESTARLVRAYSHLVLDIPAAAAGLGWDVLIRILDAEPDFQTHYRAFNELNVQKFLIADIDNPGSIRACIVAARENVRTTRDVLPEEVWEHTNELYLYCQERAEKSVGRRHRQQFLDHVVANCQMINGQVITTLRRDHAYRFLRLGHLLERADMTTRIIDVGAADLMREERHYTAVDPLIWGNLLESLSAMGTYRRTIGPLIEADAVVEFVFRDGSLPRSVRYCLDGIRDELAPLSNNSGALKVLERCHRSLARFPNHKASRAQLHEFIDSFQLDLNRLGECISESWFLPAQR